MRKRLAEDGTKSLTIILTRTQYEQLEASAKSQSLEAGKTVSKGDVVRRWAQFFACFHPLITAIKNEPAD